MTESNSKTLIALLNGLEWIYDRAVTGAPALDSASDLATSYQRRFPSDEKAVDALIKWQMAKAGTAGFGIKFGAQIAHQVIRHVSGDSLKQIEIAICCRLLATTGKTVPINFAKFVPVMGGVISAGFDAATTRIYGRTAKRLFQPMPATGATAR